MSGGPAERLGLYEESFLHKLAYRGPFDDRGIPLRRLGPPFGDQYAPVDVAQYALGLFERHLTDRRVEDRDGFLAQARWFAAHAEAAPGGAKVWPYRYPLPKWNAWPPWISGMAQGQAISVLLRAWQMTGDSAYGDLATHAYGSLERSVREGGVRATVGGGREFYEEVAVEPAAHILNGMFYALWGVLDLARATGAPRARAAFDAGAETIASVLPAYDAGYWSRYSLLYPNQVASRFYHELHVRQLTRLHERTGNERLAEHARRWRGYLRSSRCRARQAIAHRFTRAKYLLARWTTYLELS